MPRVCSVLRNIRVMRAGMRHSIGTYLELSSTMEQGATVVVIDDDADIRDGICDLLIGEGYHVLCFSDAGEVLRSKKCAERACLILLDLMMPGMNGYEFLERRKLLGGRLAKVPLIVISAVVDQNDERARGALDFIKKPFNLNQVLESVKCHCSASFIGPGEPKPGRSLH